MLIFIWGLVMVITAAAQRNYRPGSVLASGNWYRISVKEAGIHKMDLAFLSSLGVNTSNIASNTIRLYGNGGQMLAETNAGAWLDDLQENAIAVVDGGDGVFNGSDYILFYAAGPDQWIKDSANQRFSHQKNIYSDKSFYFLSIGGTGKRVVDAPVVSSPNITINSFSERYFHELDTVNFLSSGKEWYGEEFSSLPGRVLSRNFAVNIPGIVNGSSLLVQSNCIARSVGVGSSFDIQLNTTLIGQVGIASIGTGLFDLFAQQTTAIATTTASQNNLTLSYTYHPGSFNSQGWLNWFEIFARRTLSLNGVSQSLFRDWTSVGNNIGEFVVSDATANTQVWDITDPLNPARMPGTFVSNQFRFINTCSRLREYAAFNPDNLLIPVCGRNNS
ncbi:MAG: hypothetical protein WDO71_11785 [Bacteroidota bacterium]